MSTSRTWSGPGPSASSMFGIQCMRYGGHINAALPARAVGGAMGEARRRHKLRDEYSRHCVPIARARFDIFAIGTRLSPVPYIGEEVAWWSDLDEKLLGAVVRDHTDDDFGWIILARDEIGCFRWVDGGSSLTTKSRAEEALMGTIAKHVKDGVVETIGNQGDTPNTPTDLLQPLAGLPDDEFHPYFLHLINEPACAPARRVFREIAPWLLSADPHAVKEFQTAAFDQRLWEVYLWCAFREMFLDVEQLETPDFKCQCPTGTFFVEATTVAPTTSGALADRPTLETAEDFKEFNQGYMALKFGSALSSKVKKTRLEDGEPRHYWELGEVRDHPFALAIADFHHPADGEQLASMIYTQSALWMYLYGKKFHGAKVGNRLVIEAISIATHAYGEKEVESGFFDNPDHAGISAVLFSNAGTLAKFDRMGALAGFGAEGVTYVRTGFRQDIDPDAAEPTPFSVVVGEEGSEEGWADELQVFHNPNARIPLDPALLPLAVHHHIAGDQIVSSTTKPDSVLSSFTMIIKRSHAERLAD